jgi:hypothetical protein
MGKVERLVVCGVHATIDFDGLHTSYWVHPQKTVLVEHTVIETKPADLPD